MHLKTPFIVVFHTALCHSAIPGEEDCSSRESGCLYNFIGFSRESDVIFSRFLALGGSVGKYIRGSLTACDSESCILRKCTPSTITITFIPGESPKTFTFIFTVNFYFLYDKILFKHGINISASSIFLLTEGLWAQALPELVTSSID